MMAGKVMNEEIIKAACAVAVKAHTKSDKFYVEKKKVKVSSSKVVFIAFPGSYSLDDLFFKNSFGETKVDPEFFQSIKSVGIGIDDAPAEVNEAFLRKFKEILPSLEREVKGAPAEKRQVVFTGHSSGGPIAILAAVWLLERYRTQNPTAPAPLCVTFGSPLVGNHIFSHALRREKWAKNFVNLVTKHDIVPRVPLAPLSSIDEQLKQILPFFDPKLRFPNKESLCQSREAVELYVNVMKSASLVASHSACKLMGSTSLLLETALSFTELSPYRPFGTYIFFTEGEKMVVVSNPDAILQLLFYSSQLSDQNELADVAAKSLREHVGYEDKVQNLQMQKAVDLDELENIESPPKAGQEGAIAKINAALNDLGLSTRARLCLRAAGALEKQKEKNRKDVDGKREKIEKLMKSLEDYRAIHADGNLGYYDAFRLSKEEKDFQANVDRLKLAGIWDEIIEMLKRYELPDEFEGSEEWVKLGTRYRCLVEPLDIANYYRHLKNEDTGPYMKRGRPKRYRFTQRWLEHNENLADGSSWESCFWARVEELRINCKGGGWSPSEMKKELQELETKAEVVGSDVSLVESTYTKCKSEVLIALQREQ